MVKPTLEIIYTLGIGGRFYTCNVCGGKAFRHQGHVPGTPRERWECVTCGDVMEAESDGPPKMGGIPS